MPDAARFCPKCGMTVDGIASRDIKQDQPQFSAGTKVTPNIILSDDGKYRWIYEMSMFKNPTIFVMSRNSCKVSRNFFSMVMILKKCRS